MSPSLSLLVFGDICTTADTRPLFDNGSPEALFGSLSARIASADLALANLECVLSDTANPANKIGPVLRGRKADVAILGEAGFDVLGLANNPKYANSDYNYTDKAYSQPADSFMKPHKGVYNDSDHNEPAY